MVAMSQKDYAGSKEHNHDSPDYARQADLYYFKRYSHANTEFILGQTCFYRNCMAQPSISLPPMNKYLYGFGAIFLVMSMSVSALAESKTTKLKDQHGKYIGKKVQQGDTTRSYDQKSRYQGKAVKRGDSVLYYDSKGRYQGKAKIRENK